MHKMNVSVRKNTDNKLVYYLVIVKNNNSSITFSIEQFFFFKICRMYTFVQYCWLEITNT